MTQFVHLGFPIIGYTFLQLNHISFHLNLMLMINRYVGYSLEIAINLTENRPKVVFQFIYSRALIYNYNVEIVFIKYLPMPPQWIKFCNPNISNGFLMKKHPQAFQESPWKESNQTTFQICVKAFLNVKVRLVSSIRAGRPMPWLVRGFSLLEKFANFFSSVQKISKSSTSFLFGPLTGEMLENKIKI